MDILVNVLVVVLVLVNVMWTLLVVAAWVGGRDTRFVLPRDPDEATPAPGDDAPKLSLIIPARNEAHVIGAAVRAALAQDWPNLELILIDDNSTDGTADRAREAAAGDPRLRILTGTPLPEGWKGKCWALWQAQQEADGALLLFVDADVQLGPQAARRACQTLLERDLGLLSLWGTWQVESFWERVAMPVVGGFVRGAHPLDRINDPEQPEAFANGQFILVSRVGYDAFGGHEAVRDQVLEDVRIAQVAKGAGLRCGMLLAPDLFRVRMYQNLRDLWLGFVKNFYHGMEQRVGVAVAAATFASTTTLLPWLCLAFALGAQELVLGALALGCVVQMYVFRFMQDGTYRMPRAYGITHPLGTAILVGIILHSAWRGLRGTPTQWKGRPV